LNLRLLYHYIINYEPYNFKGKLSDFPLTLSYGKKMDALRRKYKTHLWNTVEGAYKYSVFVTASVKRAVVIIKKDPNKTITAIVHLPNSGKLMVATPEEPDAKPTSGTIKIPARSAAVVMEE
jgi:hypothetical protein